MSFFNAPPDRQTGMRLTIEAEREDANECLVTSCNIMHINALLAKRVSSNRFFLLERVSSNREKK